MDTTVERTRDTANSTAPGEPRIDRSETAERSTLLERGFPASAREPLPPAVERKRAGRAAELARFFAADERGAVTAEYALVIMAGVAFAGVLIAIMRSSEVRSMLLDLVQNALGSAG